MTAIDRLRRLFGHGKHAVSCAVVSVATVCGDEMRALLDLVDAIRTRRDARCWSRSLPGAPIGIDAPRCLCGRDAEPGCPCTIADRAVDAAYSKLEELP